MTVVWPLSALRSLASLSVSVALIILCTKPMLGAHAVLHYIMGASCKLLNATMILAKLKN